MASTDLTPATPSASLKGLPSARFLSLRTASVLMRSNRKPFIFIVFIAFLASVAPAAPIHPVHAAHAMVASEHELAAQAGADIMKAGGNAIDGAIATGFALAVVLPKAGNIGGGGFMLVRLANGKTHFIDYRETAPAAATANMYLDPQGNATDASIIGYRAIAVPSAVAGMTYAQAKYGKLPLAQVMAPAIRLAREGFALSWEDAVDFREPSLAKFPESHRIFQRDGNYYRAGEVLRQPELARTLERIAANPGDFYHGSLARELAADIRKGGGLVTADDLAHYQVKEREPVHGSYRGYEVISAPPPSSGGIALIETLNILEGYPLAKYGRSADAIHLTLEAFRRAFYDRAEFLGDPDFSKIPVAQLLDQRYAAAWRESIDPGHASSSKTLQRPRIFSELESYAEVHPQPAPGPEPRHTTHYSVVDPEGNAVSVTTTLNDDFGSRVTATGLGFLLNDEMDDFASKPGTPNLFGLIQGPANAIGPGKRPLSSMAPTMVLRDGHLFLVLGSRGGSRIISSIANILMGVVDYGMDIQEAVNAPRFHHQWLPDEVRLEQWFSPDTVQALQRMGHKVEFGVQDEGWGWEPRWSDSECIAIDLKTGERLGASDERDNGKAVGF